MNILLTEEYMDRLVDVANSIVLAVEPTLGPNGQNILLVTDAGSHWTKDGATVMKALNSMDPNNEAILELMKTPALDLLKTVGDGTTTATLLSSYLTIGSASVAKTSHVVRINENYIRSHCEEIVSSYHKPVETMTDIINVANIASNGDKELSSLVVEAKDIVGPKGHVIVRRSSSEESMVESEKGVKYNAGLAHPDFAFDANSKSSEMEGALVMVIKGRVSRYQDISGIITQVAASKNNLLIVCDEMDKDAMQGCLMTALNRTLPLVVAKVASFEGREDSLQDFAAYVGAEVLDLKGSDMAKVSPVLGVAAKALITKYGITVNGGGNQPDIFKGYLDGIEVALKKTKPENTRQIAMLSSRLSRLRGSIATIYIGGINEQDIKQKADRVDDTLRAVDSAIDQGISPGGGSLYYKLLKSLEKDSLKYPALINAITNYLQILGMWSSRKQYLGNTVVNLNNHKAGNAYDLGIVEPSGIFINAVMIAVKIHNQLVIDTKTIVNTQRENE